MTKAFSGLATLFLTEMWERFSYYGLRQLLVLFMSAAVASQGFGMSNAEASAIVGIYGACVWLASLPGGFVADRMLGLRRAVFIGGVLISIGHLLIGVSTYLGVRTPFFTGLVCIVLGTGLLKPSSSAMVGDLYPEGGSKRDAAFSIFYMGINLGALGGQLVTGFLGEIFGWHFGFAAAGIGMFIGLATFALLSKFTLGDIGLERTGATTGMKLALCLFLLVICGLIAAGHIGYLTINPEKLQHEVGYLLVAIAVAYFCYLFIFAGLTSFERRRVVVVFILFFFACIFWSAFEQAPTSLNLFARDYTDRWLFGWQMPATWFQAVNSVFVIAFAPVFAAAWFAFSKKGWEISSPHKFAIGLLFTAVGFALMVFPANAILSTGGALKVSIWWLTISYILQTFGELSISPVGLSSMTKLAPHRFAGQMMGVWFLSDSIGSLIGGVAGGSIDPNRLEDMPKLFTVTAAALFIAAIALFALAPIVKRYLRVSE